MMYRVHYIQKNKQNEMKEKYCPSIYDIYNICYAQPKTTKWTKNKIPTKLQIFPGN